MYVYLPANLEKGMERNQKTGKLGHQSRLQTNKKMRDKCFEESPGVVDY